MIKIYLQVEFFKDEFIKNIVFKIIFMFYMYLDKYKSDWNQLAGLS
jgi:hypothetical protein